MCSTFSIETRSHSQLQHLDFVDDVDRVALDVVVVGVLADLQAAFDVDQRTLLQGLI